MSEFMKMVTSLTSAPNQFTIRCLDSWASFVSKVASRRYFHKSTYSWALHMNSIHCSMMDPTVDSEQVQDRIYGSKTVVANSIQSKAFKELKNAMAQGIKGSLDNMEVTLGNSLAETQKRARIRVKIMACPDSGASRSLCGPNLAKRLGLKVLKERVNISNASGSTMHYEGTAFVRVTFQSRTIEVPILLSKDVEGRLILGKHDLQRLHVLPQNFPQILPDKLFPSTE